MQKKKIGWIISLLLVLTVVIVLGLKTPNFLHAQPNEEEVKTLKKVYGPPKVEEEVVSRAYPPTQEHGFSIVGKPLTTPLNTSSPSYTTAPSASLITVTYPSGTTASNWTLSAYEWCSQNGGYADLPRRDTLGYQENVYVKFTAEKKDGSEGPYSFVVHVPYTVTGNDNSAREAVKVITTNKYGAKLTDAVGGVLYLSADQILGKTQAEAQAAIKKLVEDNTTVFNLTDGTSPVSYEITTIPTVETSVAASDLLKKYAVTLGNLAGTTDKGTVDVQIWGVARPKFYQAKQGAEVPSPTTYSTLFSDQQKIGTTGNLVLQWVTKEGNPTILVATSDTFMKAYLKVTDLNYPTYSYIQEVVINIDSGSNVYYNGNGFGFHSAQSLRYSAYRQSQFAVGGSNQSTVAKVMEVMGLGNSEVKMWNTKTGEPLTPEFTTTDVVSAGEYEMFPTIKFFGKNNAGEQVTGEYDLAVPVFPDKLIPEGWEILGLDDEEINTVITNPYNEAQIGFVGRGIDWKYGSANGWQYWNGGPFVWNAVDTWRNANMVHDSTFLDMPLINDEPQTYMSMNGKPYTNPPSPVLGPYKDRGINWVPEVSNWNEVASTNNDASARTKIAPIIYLKRPDSENPSGNKKFQKYRALTAMKEPNAFFYYDISLLPNFNFEVMLNTVNASGEERKFSMLEVVDTDYVNDKVPIYALGGDSGFYMQPTKSLRYSIKLKDTENNWLSDYDRYQVMDYWGWNSLPENLENEWRTNPYFGSTNKGINYFDNDFSRTGDEVRNLPQGSPYLTGADSSYEMGASGKLLGLYDTLKTGYEIWLGFDFMMGVNAKPNEINVYESTKKTEFPTDFKVNNVATWGGNTTVDLYVQYPDRDRELLKRYVGNEVEKDPDADPEIAGVINGATFDGMINGTWNIHRHIDASGNPGGFPEDWLPEDQDKKIYWLPMHAQNMTPQFEEFVSNYYAVKFTVWRLNAEPIGQKVKLTAPESEGLPDGWKRPIMADGKLNDKMLKNPTFIPENEKNIKYVYVDKDGKEVDSFKKSVDDSTKVGLTYAHVKMSDETADADAEPVIIDIPVTIWDDEAPVEEPEEIAIEAHDIKTTVETVNTVIDNVTKRDEFILERSKAHAWLVSDGSVVEPVTVKSTTLVKNPVPGTTYYATLVAKTTVDGKELVAEKTIKIIISTLPQITIHKTDEETGDPLEGAVFSPMESFGDDRGPKLQNDFLGVLAMFPTLFKGFTQDDIEDAKNVFNLDIELPENSQNDITDSYMSYYMLSQFFYVSEKLMDIGFDPSENQLKEIWDQSPWAQHSQEEWLLTTDAAGKVEFPDWLVKEILFVRNSEGIGNTNSYVIELEAPENYQETPWQTGNITDPNNSEWRVKEYQERDGGYPWIQRSKILEVEKWISEVASVPVGAVLKDTVVEVTNKPQTGLSWTADPLIWFQPTTVPIKEAQKEIPRKEEYVDWGITITDGRIKDQAAYVVKAKLLEDFKYKEVVVPNLLVFKGTSDSPAELISKTEGKTIFTSTPATPKENKLQWDEKSGFLLDLTRNQSYDITEKGEYTGKIELTLEYGP